MKRLRGVIFDYGNTLVRLDPGIKSTRTDYADVVARPGAERLAAFLTRAGALAETEHTAFIERFLEVRERNRGLAEEGKREIPALRSLRETLFDLEITPAPDLDLGRAIEEFFQVEVEFMRAMPGAGELLAALGGRGIRVAMLSNATDGRYIARVVGLMGWSGLFDPMIVSADIGIRKPRAEAFRAVLGRWDLDPAEIAMVGDSLYHDVGGAQALGLRTVHFKAIPNAFDASAGEDVRPTLTVSTHAELQRALLP